MKTLYILFACLLFTGAVSAQTGRDVSGVVKDTTGAGVIAATVKLVSAKDTLTASTNAEGNFMFRDVKSSQFSLTATSIGYTGILKKYLYNDGTTPVVIDPIILKEESKLLNAVVVTGSRPVVIKEDTVEYRAADYKLQVNAVTEDLLKKLPGVEVDKDGNVTAQGKSVTRVKVNGKDYFGGDLQTATKNLPADLIERIQVVDDYGDQANLTGVRSGDSEKIINITIRPDRNKGVFANAVAGAGNEDRYQLSLNGNYFNNNRQISVLGNLNNTNASLFNISGGGAGNRGGQGGGGNFQGGGGQGGGGNRGGGGNNRGGGFGGGDGITSVGSIGVNFRDQWGPKISSYGNYSFFNRNNDVLSNIYQENVYSNGNIISNQTSNNNTIGNNHRFNWNIEYQIDSLNYLKVSPGITYTESDADGSSILSQVGNSDINNLNQRTITNSTSKTPNVGGSILYNHRFAKPRRNVSLNLSLNSNSTQGDQQTNFNGRYTDYNTQAFVKDSLLNQLIRTDNTSLNTSSRFLYIEPFGKRSTIELNWDYNYSKYDNNRETFDVLKGTAQVDSLSNIYNYSFASNNVGLTYRFTEQKYYFSLGISGQPTLLVGESVSKGATSRRTGFNFVPIARFTYRFSRSKELNINYFGRNTEPSYSQIQPVADRSNPNNPIIGNPNLNAEFNHSLNLRFNSNNLATGRSLFTNLSATYTEDKIVNNNVRIISNKRIIQETRYLNTDGYFAVNGFYSFSIPLAQKKYVFGFNGSANYTNNLSYSDFIKNVGKNLVLSQRFRMQINPIDGIEFNPSAGYSYNKTKNSLDIFSGSNNEVSTWTLNADTRLNFLKSFVLGADLSKNYNSGYTGSIAANPLILNTYLEKQFFKDKRGTLRLQGYDLFNQNTSVSRVVSGISTIDTRSNRLGRYFMLSFTMRIQKFTGIQPDNMQNNPGGRGAGGDGRRDGGFGGGQGGGRVPGMQ